MFLLYIKFPSFLGAIVPWCYRGAIINRISRIASIESLESVASIESPELAHCASSSSAASSYQRPDRERDRERDHDRHLTDECSSCFIFILELYTRHVALTAPCAVNATWRSSKSLLLYIICYDVYLISYLMLYIILYCII